MNLNVSYFASAQQPLSYAKEVWKSAKSLSAALALLAKAVEDYPQVPKSFFSAVENRLRYLYR